MSNHIYIVKELAEEFGVTKTAIQRYLTDDFRTKYVTTGVGSGGKQLQVNEEGYRVLYKRFKGANNGSNKRNNDVKSGSNYLDKDVLDVLQKQLSKKDEQLEEKDRQIERLQLLLNQSQQLQLKESKKLERLELKEEERKKEQESNKESDILDNTEKQEQIEKKKGFWSRLFK